MTAVLQDHQATIAWRDRQVAIEYRWVNEAAGHDPERHPARPIMVFLHEGLGSVAMWKDFPQALCQACGLKGLVYSRPGYGASTPRAADELWTNDFMHQQAHEVLPALLDELGVSQPVVLFGHSDGGSIALLFAANHPERVAATVVAAPHLFVEDVSVASIAQAQLAYESGPLKQGLARYHQDTDSAFWGWCLAWLSPNFRAWNIEAEVSAIRGPVLALQGQQDEYGTMNQIHKIAQLAPQTRLLEMADCGHSPHRDQATLLISNVKFFLEQHLGDMT
jgi:pimeloyl-ACP methyl ester carboxylesterase